MEPVLGEAAAAAFARDGVACVRSVLDPAEVAVAAAAIDAVLASPGPLAQVASDPGDPGAFTEDFCRWREVPGIERLARHSQVPAVAAALMGTSRVRFYHDHVLVKEGRTRQRTPWHQDQPYYNVDGRGVSAWIPVDPVPEDGCLELVAGSHRGPWLMPRTFLLEEARWFPEGSLAELPDIDAGRGAFDIRRFGLAPGDAVFFDFLTVHGAPGFRTRAGGGSCRCGTCQPGPGTRRARGAPRRPSTGWPGSSPPGRPWTIRCSRSSGQPDPPHQDTGVSPPGPGPGASAVIGLIRSAPAERVRLGPPALQLIVGGYAFVYAVADRRGAHPRPAAAGGRGGRDPHHHPAVRRGQRHRRHRRRLLRCPRNRAAQGTYVTAMVLAMSVSAVLVAATAAVTLLLPGRAALRPAPVPEA